MDWLDPDRMGFVRILFLVQTGLIWIEFELDVDQCASADSPLNLKLVICSIVLPFFEMHLHPPQTSRLPTSLRDLYIPLNEIELIVIDHCM